MEVHLYAVPQGVYPGVCGSAYHTIPATRQTTPYYSGRTRPATRAGYALDDVCITRHKAAPPRIGRGVRGCVSGTVHIMSSHRFATAPHVSERNVGVSTQEARGFACVHMLLSVAMVGVLISDIDDVRAARRASFKQLNLLKKKLDRELILSLDQDGGGVDKMEFVVGMLTRHDLVDVCHPPHDDHGHHEEAHAPEPAPATPSTASEGRTAPLLGNQ